MDTDRARALAERLHCGRPDAGGAPLIDHVRRVAAAVTGDARVVAWLHEVFEYTSISEDALLTEGLSLDELRALRLLTHDKDSRSHASYLAQVELIARAKGAGASIARSVKAADLADRALNPPIRANGWSPPHPRRWISAAGTRSRSQVTGTCQMTGTCRSANALDHLSLI